MDLTNKPFGTWNGVTVYEYTMKNDNGISVSFITYGGAITRIITPDKNGEPENIVLGFDTLEEYIDHTHFFGGLIGRVAGRIGKAQYLSDGKSINLTRNEGENHLHGGRHGFDRVLWKAEPIEVRRDEVSVQLFYFSSDGEEGYPGNVHVAVTYTLTNRDELRIEYQAETDQDTPINMTSHSYFNLSGDYKEDILSHELTIQSEQFLELSEEMLPTGKIEDVKGTPFDFRSGQTIGEGVRSSHPQIVKVGGGYDHPFLLNPKHERTVELRHEDSGRKLTIETNQKAVVLYTGNHLEGNFSIRGVPSRKHLGLCLETQGYPDAVNHSAFPSVIVKKGERYTATTTYTFQVER